MRTKAIIAAAIWFACLSGPALGAQDLALFDPDEGIGGYVGPLVPIDQPVVLAWHPRTGIIGTVETLSLLPDDEEESIITIFTGAVIAERGGLNRRFAVSELSVNGHHITATQPLVVIQGWSDIHGGNVRDLMVSFPGFVEVDIAPPVPGTPQHQLWVDTFGADLAYTKGAIATNQSVFEEGSYHHLLEAQARSVIGNPEGEIIENTFMTRAKGLSPNGGALVAELTGRIDVRFGVDRLIMESHGFGLIDLQSGLSSGTSRTLITAIRGGREVQRTVIVDVQYLN